jgi:hypothetical protein
MRTSFIAGTALLALAGCGPATTRPSTVSDRAPVPSLPAGLERVMGQDAPALVRLLGQPAAEMREGTARKLQFAGPICVLDAYLYPKDNAAPRVTWVDARQPDGGPIDRASCIAALTRRAEAP